MFPQTPGHLHRIQGHLRTTGQVGQVPRIYAGRSFDGKDTQMFQRSAAILNFSYVEIADPSLWFVQCLVCLAVFGYL